MSNKVTFLTKRWQHHTESGGYDRLARVVGGRIITRSAELRGVGRLPRWMWKKIGGRRPFLLDYRFEDWRAEWRLLAQASLRKPEIVHVLYGDDQLDVLLRRRRWLPCPLVVTFHLPTTRDSVRDRFEKIQEHLVKGVDVAIVVGRNQLADCQKWFGASRVAYVPHGIDTVRFCPGEKRLEQSVLRLLTVGDHMRDWDSLRLIFEKCAHLRLPVEFDVVLQKSFHHHLSDCAGVRLHAGISEADLISLYRAADALLLPVIDATANNAVLESISCGTPVITSDVGGIPDYVGAEAGWLFPKGEADEIVKLISSACGNREVFSSRRAAARVKSLEFDWERIKEQILPIYDAAKRGSPVDVNNNAPVTAKARREGFEHA